MTKKQLLSYGLLGFSKDLLIAFSGGLVMLYFTDALVLSPMLVGSIVFFGRLLDALDDVVVAYFMDYLSIAYKKWYLAGIIGSILTFITLYSLGTNTNFAQLVPLIVLLYLLLGISHTLMDVSYWSMLPKLSQKNQSKITLSTLATFFSSS
ncbi:Melibiose carrier protein [Streptococcus varani]|uniref:Melibiose carrier protein n=1 Tax=Streptococcus varani TaxID=1608583 RepID=A0A0E4H4U9_9STRE|nr:Melibiose carrier protein [Streptococcus varani]